MARATAADCYSLHGAAWANGFHRTGGAGSRRRSGRLHPLPRGFVPARGRGDRSRRNAIGAGRSRALTGAFSSEVDTASREENASKQESDSGRKNTMTGVYDFTATSRAGNDIP